MSAKFSERRLAENQVIFRRTNEQAVKGLNKLKKAAESEGLSSLAPNTDIPLHFYCECSDENCRQRIILKPSEYISLRQNNSQFVLMPGHDVPGVEQVVYSSDKLIVVEKYKSPPPAKDSLNSTFVDNS